MIMSTWRKVAKVWLNPKKRPNMSRGPEKTISPKRTRNIACFGVKLAALLLFSPEVSVLPLNIHCKQKQCFFEQSPPREKD